MIDPSPFEQEAMAHAGDMGGEYLESLNKTDLVTLSQDEWDTLVNVICTAYSDSLYRTHHRLEGDLRRVQDLFAPPMHTPV